jgi:osmotically-inducible protein OsmY
MRSDSDIKRDVEDELRWDPDIDPTDIAVSVNSGVVTLAGFVRSYMQKYQAEQDAKRVAGVIGVVNDIEVRLPGVDERPDPEIARDAVTQIKNELPYSWDRTRVIVKKGWVTLEGEVEWNYQRTRAEDAVRRVRGIRGVTNSGARSRRHCAAPPRSMLAASVSRRVAARSSSEAPCDRGPSARRRNERLGRHQA